MISMIVGINIITNLDINKFKVLAGIAKTVFPLFAVGCMEKASYLEIFLLS
jgi:hypothetical protein